MPLSKQYKRSPSNPTAEAGDTSVESLMSASSSYNPVMADDTQNADEIKMEIPDTLEINNRDPQEINQHLKVAFYEVFAEPHPTIHSFDKIWVLSFIVFGQTKLWCYRIMTAICALPCAVCWGVYFACLSFCNIWLWVPSLRGWAVQLTCIKRLYEPCMGAFCEPFWAAVGKLFSSVNVTIKK